MEEACVKLYVPRVMAEKMLATTAKSNSIHFDVGHMCHKHNQIFTMEHVEDCDGLLGCNNISAKRLKEQHILEWEPE